MQASDFSVSIDGEIRRVVQAQFVSLRPRQLDASQPAPAAADVFYTSNSDQTPGRLIVIAVDEESILFGEGRHVMRAAGAFVDSLSPQDRVALLAVPQPGLYIDFTSNHDRIRRALDGMSGLGTARQPGNLNVSLWEAYQIAEHHNTSVEAAVVGRLCPDDLFCPTRVRQTSRQIVREQRFQSSYARRGLESLLGAMRELEGPNAVVWISGGFVIDGSVSLLGIRKLAAASRTTLYMMMVDAPLIDMSQASPPPTPRDDRRMKEEGLLALAAFTGGRLIRAHFNPGPLFDQLERELSGYYLLSVESSPTDSDEERRAIKVSVRREGARVRARREVSFTSEDADRTVDERLARMLRSPVATQELPLRVATYAYQDTPTSQVRVLVAAEVGAAEGVPSALTLGFVLRDPEETVVLRWKEQITPRLTQTSDGPVLETSFPISVEPGTYSLRLAVVDASGRRGSVEHPVHAEPMWNGPFAVGDLVVADQSLSLPDGMLPSVEARVSSGRLLAYTELYADSSAAWKRTEVHVEVADDATGPVRAQATAMMQGPEGTLHRVVSADVAVAHLPPGRYVARVSVIHDSTEVARVRRPFWISEPPVVSDDDGQQRDVAGR